MSVPEETYLDHNASAPLLPEARAAILRTLDAGPGNPSSSHAAGRRLRRVLGDSRELVARLVGARASEVVFTSGTSESNALALRGLLRGLEAQKRRLVMSAADHDGTHALAGALEAEGVEVVMLGVDRWGVVGVPDVLAATEDAPCVVTIAAAEPVTGALQPIAELARTIGAAPLHCDAAQLVGRRPVDFPALGVTSLAFSAHKIGGPHGVGALVVRDGAPFDPPGGESAQERGRRAGTEAVALAAGFAAAAQSARRWPERYGDEWRTLLGPLRSFVTDHPDGEILTPGHSLPNTLLVRFAGCPGDAVLAALDGAGFCVSTGTACASGARTPPRVLTASGRSAIDAAECVRVSVGHGSAGADIERLVDALRATLPRIRAALAPGADDG